MTDNITALIAEARMWPRDGVNEGPLINDLADALEATIREMHARELHHFENEELLEALEEIRRNCDHEWENRVAGGSKCRKCHTWQDERVTTEAERSTDGIMTQYGRLAREGEGEPGTMLIHTPDVPVHNLTHTRAVTPWKRVREDSEEL